MRILLLKLIFKWMTQSSDRILETIYGILCDCARTVREVSIVRQTFFYMISNSDCATGVMLAFASIFNIDAFYT